MPPPTPMTPITNNVTSAVQAAVQTALDHERARHDSELQALKQSVQKLQSDLSEAQASRARAEQTADELRKELAAKQQLLKLQYVHFFFTPLNECGHLFFRHPGTISMMCNGNVDSKLVLYAHRPLRQSMSHPIRRPLSSRALLMEMRMRTNLHPCDSSMTIWRLSTKIC